MFIFHPQLQKLARQHLKYRKVSESYVNSEWQIIISRISLSRWTCPQLRGLRRAALCWKTPNFTPGRSCRLGQHSSQCLRTDISWPFYRDMNADKILNTKSNVANEKYLQRLENLPTGIPTSYFSVAQMSTYFLIKPKSTQTEVQVHSRPVANHIPCHKI